MPETRPRNPSGVVNWTIDCAAVRNISVAMPSADSSGMKVHSDGWIAATISVTARIDEMPTR